MAHPADHHAETVSSSTTEAQPNGDSEQDDREATELHDYRSSDERVVVNGSAALSSARSRSTTTSRNSSTIKTFWARHVVATVPHEACRDHFGTLMSHMHQ